MRILKSFPAVANIVLSYVISSARIELFYSWNLKIGFPDGTW